MKMAKHSLFNLILIVLFIGCNIAENISPASESAKTRGPTGLLSDSSVTLKLVKQTKTGASEMADGDILTKNDAYAMTFHTEKRVHIYVFQIDATNKIFPLFPNGEYCDMVNPVKSDTTCRVPAKNKWLFIDNNAGTEEIILLARPKPLENPKKICKSILFSPRKVGGFRETLPYDDMIVIRRHFIHQ